MSGFLAKEQIPFIIRNRYRRLYQRNLLSRLILRCLWLTWPLHVVVCQPKPRIEGFVVSRIFIPVICVPTEIHISSRDVSLGSNFTGVEVQRLSVSPDDFATPAKLGPTILACKMAASFAPLDSVTAPKFRAFLGRSRDLSLCRIDILDCFLSFSFNKLLCCIPLAPLVCSSIHIYLAEMLASVLCVVMANVTMPFLTLEASPLRITLFGRNRQYLRA